MTPNESVDRVTLKYINVREYDATFNTCCASSVSTGMNFLTVNDYFFFHYKTIINKNWFRTVTWALLLQKIKEEK